ncbi:TetR/AcrR family transcriptional regulator C-terminal domain-containing protein [Nonomuraea sp. 10N515B]|uniref:TetR/AcrR family transcriptional regulator C-terminal domain-containing protein n=1 Tax=Nonomuraea sp. 10N515B TaxID=3457422 RepID=UPI003FCD50FD
METDLLPTAARLPAWWPPRTTPPRRPPITLEGVLAGVRVPEADPRRWREQLEEATAGLREALLVDPGVARAALESPVCPQGLRVREGMLAIMRAAGLPEATRAAALTRLLLYAIADAAYQHAPDGRHPSLAACRHAPEGRHPRLASAPDAPCGECFRFGLKLLLDGLAAALPDRAG